MDVCGLVDEFVIPAQNLTVLSAKPGLKRTLTIHHLRLRVGGKEEKFMSIVALQKLQCARSAKHCKCNLVVGQAESN